MKELHEMTAAERKEARRQREAAERRAEWVQNIAIIVLVIAAVLFVFWAD